MFKHILTAFFAQLRLRTLTIGSLLIAAGICLGLALFSYSSLDASFNFATTEAPINQLGKKGAYLADFLYHIYGASILLLIPALLLWGGQYLMGIQQRLWLRVTMMVVSLHLISILSTMASSPVDRWKNSLWGLFSLRHLQSLCSEPWMMWMAGSIICTAALVSFSVAFSLSVTHWKRLLRGSMATLPLAYHWARRIPLSKKEASKEAPWAEAPWEASADEAEPSLRVAPRLKMPTLKEQKASVTKAVPAKKFEPTPPASLNDGAYQLPSSELLKAVPSLQKPLTAHDPIIKNSVTALRQVLTDYGVEGEIIQVHPGPVVILYELEPAPGIKSSRIIGLADDIARSMSALAVRIAVIPGRNVIGIELPTPQRQTVYLREMLEAESYHRPEIKLPIVLGKTIAGDATVVDLARMPHLLIAGTTGSGKSVAINTMILSLLYRLTPEQCKFIMIDPKMLELSVYDGIPHLLSPVVTEPGKAVVALKWVVKEMENRYRSMSTLGVRNVESYNLRIQEARAQGEILERDVITGFDPETGKPKSEKVPLSMDALPFIVVIVDEMADLMLVAGKDIETSIQRLAQMARAAGIHIVMATQRPSVDVITGVIKANFPTRISFQVTSRIDSRTILGEQGAEQLLGQGDMLYMAGGGKITRVHGPFVSDHEVERVVSHLKSQQAPSYIDDIVTDSDGDDMAMFDAPGESSGDALYDQAVAVVLQDGKASISYVQRCLKIGYNRAASLIERMEKEGMIGAPNHVGKREILVPHQ